MSKAIIVTDKASGEIRKAVIWYADQFPELGTRFIEVFEFYVRRIIKYPAIFKKVDKDVSSCLIKKFPYVFFSQKPPIKSLFVFGITNKNS